LALAVRAPRPDVADNDRRRGAVEVACEAVIAGYGLDDTSAGMLLAGAAVVLDDAADYWETIGRDAGMVSRARWKADWFRTEAHR
jgi:hypothetical protein